MTSTASVQSAVNQRPSKTKCNYLNDRRPSANNHSGRIVYNYANYSPSPMIRSVATGTQWKGPMKLRIVYMNSYPVAWLSLIESLRAQTFAWRKHGALRPQKPFRLSRDGEVGGSGIFIFNTYSLHCRHQNDSALRCVRHFNVSLIVWVKSPDSVHKPQFLKRKESRSGSNRSPSAYQPIALPLGYTGSHLRVVRTLRFIPSDINQPS